MAKFLVPVQGRLIVEADSEKAAKELVTAFLVLQGLPSIKGQEYGIERLDTIVEANSCLS